MVQDSHVDARYMFENDYLLIKCLTCSHEVSVVSK